MLAAHFISGLWILAIILLVISFVLLMTGSPYSSSVIPIPVGEEQMKQRT